jgi:AcrR family transcriptional regulator
MRSAWRTMGSSSAAEPLQGLRERKKAKTRAAIQDAALTLFQRQSYDETTVEQIAELAEVSPSTFFRYFPTKEDTVLHDRYDPILLARFLAQPAELGPIKALRETLRSVLGSLPTDELARERMRGALIMSVPALRAQMLDRVVETLEPFTEAVAARTGRRADDAAVRTLTGAVLGVMIAVMLQTSEDPDADYLALADEALAQLEAGLPV